MIARFIGGSMDGQVRNVRGGRRFSCVTLLPEVGSTQRWLELAAMHPDERPPPPQRIETYVRSTEVDGAGRPTFVYTLETA